MMRFTKRGSLLALVLAGRTFATPLLESLFGRDNGKCVTSYTSGNGLNFTNIQCNQNNPWNDALAPFTTDTMSECMEYCSRFWGNGEGCFGVVFRETDNQCWMRNSTTSTLSNGRTTYSKPLIGTQKHHSALVDLSQMKGFSTACPAADKSRHSLDGFDGIQYTVQCNKDISGQYDARWSYAYHDNPFQAYYHASSLEDCLQNCMKEHPLCRGVVWVPGLTGGYANCWPKTSFDQNLSPQNVLLKVTHSATIDQIQTPDTACIKSDTYTSTSSDSKNFAIYCGQANQGTNMTSVRAGNFTSCMESCASNKNGCVGAVYDSTLSQGFENCYLQNTSSVFTNVGTSMYGVVTNKKPTSSGTPNPGSNDGNNNNGNGNGNSGNQPSSGNASSGSKAWIAGVVIGIVFGTALIGGAIWFVLRRRKAADPPAHPFVEVADAGKRDAYAPHGGPTLAYTPATELGGQEHVEMEARDGATKYEKEGNTQGARPGQSVFHEMG